MYLGQGRIAAMVKTALVIGGLTLAMGVAQPASADSAAVVVKMSDKPPKFMPEKATIKVGQTVQWVNNAQTLHSVDADPSMVQNAKDVVLPPGAKPFDSGFMTPGNTYEHKFTVPGTYKYTCVPHEKDGMMGEVVVTK
ncbi:MAG TPA: plastocyanin/azurin family copper-binding protein [Candidatus Binataceae bacterium]|nr:plastocyanin/azurin family copper-binding protein [Candidatus Binataceae bacterium]